MAMSDFKRSCGLSSHGKALWSAFIVIVFLIVAGNQLLRAGTLFPDEPSFSSNSTPVQIKVIILWLGPGMFLVFLGVFNLVQTFKSKTGLETAAKLLVNCLGFLLVFWIWNTFKIEHTKNIENFLTEPAPSSGGAKIWSGAVTAVAMFALLFLLEVVADLTSGNSICQAATVFLSCIAIYLLAPLTLLLQDPGQLQEANFFHIATGLVIGGTLYLIFLLFGLAKVKFKTSPRN
jgi:hypothetical protein